MGLSIKQAIVDVPKHSAYGMPIARINYCKSRWLRLAVKKWPQGIAECYILCIRNCTTSIPTVIQAVAINIGIAFADAGP